MFVVLLLIGSAYLAMTALRRGPRAAAAAAFALAVLLPCWSYVDVGAVRIDIRTALALVGIGCVVLHPQSALRPRFLFADAIVAALIGTIIAAEAISTTITQTVVVEILVQWIVPYWLGRIACSDRLEVERLLTAVAPVCLLLSAWAVVESVTRMNPVGFVLGHVGSSQSMYDLRWGLRRAEGPLTHPIFFGLHLMLLFPFAYAAARRAGADGPFWLRKLPWIVAAGIFCTMSRGPQMGVVLTFIATIAVLRPKLRLPILAPVAAAALAAVAAGDMILDLLHHWSGERPMIVEIHGQPVTYTGTTHRLLQLLVYSEAVEHADWLGYGSIALRAGSNRVPYVQDDLRQLFSSIDNHYLQFVLQCGFLGLGLFVLLCVTAITYAWQAAARSEGPARELAAGLGGALLAITLLMASVWLPSDYRFLLLIVVGAAGSLKLSVPRRAAAGTAVTPRAPGGGFSPLELCLSPGHRAPAHA